VILALFARNPKALWIRVLVMTLNLVLVGFPAANEGEVTITIRGELNRKKTGRWNRVHPPGSLLSMAFL
jgi:hypothetical protein